MKKTILVIIGLGLSFGGGYYFKSATSKRRDTSINVKVKENMKLGAFSVSLSVKDIKTSKLFYENLGFTQFAGELEKNYLIMKNGSTLIGLFQGMFQNNILTFNPGWDENASTLAQFEDIRAIQRTLKASGVKLETEADEKTRGPASLTIIDPDGNVILLDQHI
jgi:predicted lactoylglutathione lyase